MKPGELKFHFSPFPRLAPVRSSRFNDLTIQRFNAVFASPTLSNRIQPNPTTPSPSGKETVKFLAIFDHLSRARRATTQFVSAYFTPSPLGERLGQRRPLIPCHLVDPPQNFLAPPDGFAIVPRILGNWILNEMDNHGT